MLVGVISDIAGIVTVLLVVAGVVAFIAVQLRARRRAAKAAMQAAAAKLGLTADGEVLRGQVDGSEVEIEQVLVESSGDGYHRATRVGIRGGLASEAGFGRRRRGSDPPSQDERVGDPALDALVEVRGTRAGLLTALAPDDRAALARALAKNAWTLADGVLTAVLDAARIDELEATAREGLALAACLREASKTLAEHLLERVASDPEAGVRHAALHRLTRGAGTPAQRDAALASALAHADPGTRFEAARHLDDVPALLALARHGHAGALDALAKPARRAAFVEAFAAWSKGGFAATTEGGVVLANALSWMPVDGADDALCRLLQHQARDAQLAAARALRAVGTAAAVPALGALRDLGGDLGAAADDAIVAIRARAHAAPAGALSLPAGEAGAVALATQPADRQA